MQVKMYSIMAGPDGCADAGATVPVSDEFGEALVKGGFAKKARRGATETAAIDHALAEQQERERAAELAQKREEAAKAAGSVQEALSRLDHDDDEDWTGGGKPAMHRIKELTGSTTITRAEVDEIAPDFVRVTGAGSPPQIQPAAQTAPRGGGSVKSSKP